VSETGERVTTDLRGGGRKRDVKKVETVEHTKIGGEQKDSSGRGEREKETSIRLTTRQGGKEK